jgi:hypothetical protein
LAVGQHPVGGCNRDQRLVEAIAFVLERKRRAAGDRGAGGGLQGAARGCGRGGCGCTGSPPPLASPLHQRIDVAGIVGAGVDHRHLASPTSERLRAGVGEGDGLGASKRRINGATRSILRWAVLHRRHVDAAAQSQERAPELLRRLLFNSRVSQLESSAAAQSLLKRGCNLAMLG